MSQSLVRNYIHLVFSTKNRTDTIPKTGKAEVFSYITSILNQSGCQSLCMGGTCNHLHILFILPQTLSLAEIVRIVKSNTSKWIHEREGYFSYFEWQDGYGAFSVSASHVEAVRNYILHQEEHHRIVTYMDEFRTLCRKNKAPLDERYVWG